VRVRLQLPDNCAQDKIIIITVRITKYIIIYAYNITYIMYGVYTNNIIIIYYREIAAKQMRRNA